MSHIKNDRATLAGIFHDAKAEHIHHQIVVTKIHAAFTQNDAFVTAFREFLHDVFYLSRAQELRLFHVDDITGFRQCFNQIGLTRQKCG